MDTTPPAAVTLDGHTITLADWHLDELHPDYYGDIYLQIGGWLTTLDTAAPMGGTARLDAADLPGREVATGQTVRVEAKSYGGRQHGTGRFIKLAWRHGYSARHDARRNPR